LTKLFYFRIRNHYKNIKFIINILLNNYYSIDFILNTINSYLKLLFHKLLTKENNDTVTMINNECSPWLFLTFQLFLRNSFPLSRILMWNCLFSVWINLIDSLKNKKGALPKFSNKNGLPYKIPCKDCDALYVVK